MSKENDGYVEDLVFPSERIGYAIGEGSMILKYIKNDF